MKRFYLCIVTLLQSIISTGLLISCSSEDSFDIKNEQEVIATKTCSMTLNGKVLSFDIDSIKNTYTRGESADWADGSSLYIVFNTLTSSVYGTANYYTSHGWSISYTGDLPSNQAGKCIVYFFENPLSNDYPTVQLAAKSIVYADYEGSWEYDEATNLCIINAILKPAVSRIRFKGDNGTKISLSGISRFVNYDISEGKLNSTNSEFDIMVESNGYTPYVYGFFEEGLGREMSITNGDYCYTAMCGSNVLAIGESGYMNIPTETSHSGWTTKQAMQTSGAVDLGLSVKWAACNLGASSPEEYGDYYAWGETETKADYTSATYAHNGQYSSYNNIGEDIAGTQYDVAYVKLGGNWRMPTVEQIQEMMDKCKIEEITYKGTQGQKITGPSNNSIFIPQSGYYNGRSIEYRDDYGKVCFWTSQDYTAYNNYAYYYSGRYSKGNIDNNNKAYGLPIRPIYIE